MCERERERERVHSIDSTFKTHLAALPHPSSLLNHFISPHFNRFSSTTRKKEKETSMKKTTTQTTLKQHLQVILHFLNSKGSFSRQIITILVDPKPWLSLAINQPQPIRLEAAPQAAILTHSNLIKLAISLMDLRNLLPLQKD